MENVKKLTIKAAKAFGVVTKGNSKIHGSTFSTDPKRCNVGQKLVNVKGSTCESCYALKLAKVYVAKKQVRIVYEIINDILIVKVIAIGKREDMEVYKQAEQRK